MVVMTNDVFIGTVPAGVRFLEEDSSARSANAISNEIADLVAVWDAGTEVNQTPGAGPDIPMNQDFDNTGDADPDPTIRYYADPTNDLATVTDFVDVEIVLDTDDGGGNYTFLVSVDNVSGGNPFQGLLTPVVYGAHDGAANMFTMGMAASPGLEELAEDGVPVAFAQELVDAGWVGSDVEGAGPIAPGDSYVFTFTTSAAEPYFNLATMIVPSNDTFASLGEVGVDLFGGNAILIGDHFHQFLFGVSRCVVSPLGGRILDHFTCGFRRTKRIFVPR